MTRIISYIICGPIWAGKGTLSKYLADILYAEVFRLSSIPTKLLDSVDALSTRENLAKMSASLRYIFWEDIFIRAVERYIDTYTGMSIIFDGPRRVDMIQAIQKLTDATIIYIDAPPEIRYTRVSIRDDKIDERGVTYEQFQDRDTEKNERELPFIRDIADSIIENTGTLEEVQKKLLTIINSHT